MTLAMKNYLYVKVIYVVILLFFTGNVTITADLQMPVTAGWLPF